MAVKGLRELKRKLRRMPNEARKEIKAAIETGAQEITAMQKRLVPERTGDLRRSIGWTSDPAKVPKYSQRAGTTVKGGAGVAAIIFAGNTRVRYAALVEFGTAPHAQPKNRLNHGHHPGSRARPFFFPAYRALRRRVKSRITRASTKAAKKVTRGGK